MPRSRRLCTVSLVTAAAFAHAAAPPLAAQPAAPALERAEQLHREASRGLDQVSGHRLARYSAFGSLTGAALALGYWSISQRGLRGGACEPLNCALPYLTLSGAVAGLFLARELELQRIALAPREGGVLRLDVEAVPLPAEPLRVLQRDSLLVIASDSGLLVGTTWRGGPLPAPRTFARRALGLRDPRAITWLAPTDVIRHRVLLGTATAMWDVPLTGGVARRVHGGGAITMASGDSAGRVVSVVSSAGRFLRRHDVVTAQIHDSLDMQHPIRAVHWDAYAKHWWVATDSALFGTRAEPETAITRLESGASVRSVTTSRDWIVVATGEGGVRAWDRRALTSGGILTPRVVQGEPRFAYDVAFQGDTLYVAGGADGVFRVALDPTPRVTGSTRQGGFATVLLATPDGLLVGDRSSRALVRLR